MLVFRLQTLCVIYYYSTDVNIVIQYQTLSLHFDAHFCLFQIVTDSPWLVELGDPVDVTCSAETGNDLIIDIDPGVELDIDTQR